MGPGSRIAPRYLAGMTGRQREGAMNQAAVQSVRSGNGAGGPAAFLRIRDLEKRFGLFTALKDINLDVMKSEFVCFLGPSGCGKTTLLRAIAGLDPQDDGLI